MLKAVVVPVMLSRGDIIGNIDVTVFAEVAFLGDPIFTHQLETFKRAVETVETVT
jgi:hypothetical protein